MNIIIYDTGQVYSLEIDPQNPPEWITRASEQYSDVELVLN